MSWIDRLFGRDDTLDHSSESPNYPRTTAHGRSDDGIAVERYRYLLRTASPEMIEEVHTEAFSKLTSRQRDLLFEQLSENAPPGDRPIGNDPQALAQSATRSELRRPGTMERSLRGAGGGPGLGGTFGSSMLGAVTGYVIGSAIVSTFLPVDDGTTDVGGDATDDATGGDAPGDLGGGFSDFGGFDF